MDAIPNTYAACSSFAKVVAVVPPPAPDEEVLIERISGSETDMIWDRFPDLDVVWISLHLQCAWCRRNGLFQLALSGPPPSMPSDLFIHLSLIHI